MAEPQDDEEEQKAEDLVILEEIDKLLELEKAPEETQTTEDIDIMSPEFDPQGPLSIEDFDRQPFAFPNVADQLLPEEAIGAIIDEEEESATSALENAAIPPAAAAEVNEAAEIADFPVDGADTDNIRRTMQYRRIRAAIRKSDAVRNFVQDPAIAAEVADSVDELVEIDSQVRDISELIQPSGNKVQTPLRSDFTPTDRKETTPVPYAHGQKPSAPVVSTDTPPTREDMTILARTMDAAHALAVGIYEVATLDPVNLARGVGERITDLAGGLYAVPGALQRTVDETVVDFHRLTKTNVHHLTVGGEKYVDEQTADRDVHFRFNIGPLHISSNSRIAGGVGANFFENRARGLREVDLGYEPGTSWQDVKDAPLREFLPYAMEQGIISTPDMAAVIANLPTYVVARTGEIGAERAARDGRDNEPTVEDLIVALPTSVAVALLERIGAKGILGIDDAVRHFKDVPRAAISAALKESATEFAQESIETFGETFLTESGFKLAEALERGLAGAVAGGPFGGSVRTVTGTVQASVNKLGSDNRPAQHETLEHSGLRSYSRRQDARAHMERTIARHEQQIKEKDATDLNNKVTRLRKTIEQTPAYKRRAKAIRRFIKESSKDTNVYIDGNAFLDLQIDNPRLFNAVKADLNIDDNMLGQAALGQDIPISVGDLVTSEVGYDPLVEIIKTETEGVTLKEMQSTEYEQNKAFDLDALQDLRRIETEQESGYRVVADAISTQLQDVGQTKEKADAVALVAGSVFRRLAEEGFDSQQVFDRIGLKIRGETRSVDLQSEPQLEPEEAPQNEEGAVREEIVEPGAGFLSAEGQTQMTFDKYLKIINPTGKRLTSSDLETFGLNAFMADAPREQDLIRIRKKGLPTITTEQFGEVAFYRPVTPDGRYVSGVHYAIGVDKDTGERKVLGSSEEHVEGDNTGMIVSVAPQARGQGIGTGLMYLWVTRTPFFPSGGFSAAGEATMRKAFQLALDNGYFKKSSVRLEQGPVSFDPLDVDGSWQNANVSVSFEDGSSVIVSAREAARLVRKKIIAARNMIKCINEA